MKTYDYCVHGYNADEGCKTNACACRVVPTYDPFTTGLKTAVKRCGLRFERPNQASMTVRFWDGDQLVFEDSQIWGFDFLKAEYGLTEADPEPNECPTQAGRE